MLENHKISALVPARSGSVRVDGKNLREIQGLPLVGRKVMQLAQSKYIDKIYVGSDSLRILEVAERFGAIPVMRNPLACDESMSPANVMIGDFVNRVEGDLVVWAHCTNPFLYAHHYDIAIMKFLEVYDEFDSLMSVIKIQSHMWNKYGFPVNYNPHAKSHTLAKDLDPFYFQDGGIFIQKMEDIRRNSYFFGKKPYLIEHDFFDSFDLNTETDFQYANLLSKAMDEKWEFNIKN